MRYWLLLIGLICSVLITTANTVGEIDCIYLGNSKQPPVKRRTLKEFIDSLTNTPGIRMDKRRLMKERYDTILVNGQYQVVRNNGLVKQYFKLKNKSKSITDLDNCNSFLGIGKKVFLKDTLRCWTRFQYDSRSCFSYNSASFVTGVAGPDDNCSGSLCRVYTYAVISVFGADTSIKYLSYTDDITGLRYGDVNHDGWLDFLDIQQGLDLDAIRAVQKKEKSIRTLNVIIVPVIESVSLHTNMEDGNP